MREISGPGREFRVQAMQARSSADRAAATLAIDSWQALKVLVSIIAMLTAASTIAAFSLYFFEWPEDSFGYEMVKLFWLDSEQNIPTLYQCSALFAASVLFIVIGRRGRRAGTVRVSYWYGLGAVFMVLGVDEGAGLHETVGDAINSTYDTRFGASWSFFYIPAALVVLAWLTPFLLQLPARTRNLLILSGALYVSGSVAVEIISQVHVLSSGRTNPVYAGLATLEEVLEMLGVAVLIFTLLEYLRVLPQPRDANGP